MKSNHYKCGCPVGTPSRWRKPNGTLTTTGSLHAATTQCVRCNKSTQLNNHSKIQPVGA